MTEKKINTISTRFTIDILFDNEEKLNSFIGEYSNAKTIYIESEGKLVSVNVEQFEVEEIVFLEDEE